MRQRLLGIVIRVVVVVIGGYLVASGLVALLAVGLADLVHMARSEAVILSSMLGFLIYLALLIWGFSYPKLLRLSLCFTALAAASFALVVLIGRLKA